MSQSNMLKSLQVLHTVLIIGLVLFASIAVFVVYKNVVIPAHSHLDKILQLVAIVISAAAVFIGASILKKKVQLAKDSTGDAKSKFFVYRSACIIQWALLEGAALFCIVCFILVGNLAYIALAAVLILWLYLAGPSKTKMMVLLALSETEMEEL